MIGIADPVAPLLGTTIAQVKFRKGYLHDDAEAERLLSSKLSPLDLLLVNNKGRLSGNTIPGLFTHTVVYLGTEAELKRLGLWNDPVIAPFHAAIREGKVFQESDYKGVHLSSAQQVLDVDRVIVLRGRCQTRQWLRKSLLSFFDHMGSRFDFRFDASDPARLYCSELVFHVLPELKLPVRHLYNRDVVLPDDIAATGLQPSTNLSFVLYVRGGPSGWTSEPSQKAIADLVAEWQR